VARTGILLFGEGGEKTICLRASIRGFRADLIFRVPEEIG